jgi:simple sugar transport system permease protein
MQNYIVAFFVQYLLNYVVRDPDSYAIQSYALPEDVSLFRFIPGTRIHVGLILLLVVVVIAYIILYRTKWGYILRVTGLNEKFAKYSGVKVAFVIIIAQVLGTAIAGLGGAVEMFGIYNTFKFAASPGYGWDGIIVATLAKLNPAFVPVAALFIAYIRVGADVLNRSTNIPPEIVSIVQAIIILFIAAKAFMKAAKEKKIVEKSREVASEGAN